MGQNAGARAVPQTKTKTKTGTKTQVPSSYQGPDRCSRWVGERGRDTREERQERGVRGCYGAWASLVCDRELIVAGAWLKEA